jgi:hypothetical protein
VALATTPHSQDHHADNRQSDRSRRQLNLGAGSLLGQLLTEQPSVMTRTDPFREGVDGAGQILAGAVYLRYQDLRLPAGNVAVDLAIRAGSAAGRDRTMYLDCPTWIRHDTSPFCTAASRRHRL